MSTKTSYRRTVANTHHVQTFAQRRATYRYPINGTCDVCGRKGHRPVIVSGDVWSSDGVMMDRFVCAECF